VLRVDVFVGRRAKGGYECELDVVAFHPGLRRLVHVEPSLDAQSWDKREAKFARKFAAGREHIPTLFEGVGAPQAIDQIALLVFASTANVKTVGGGTVIHVSQLYREILRGVRTRRVESDAVPEQFPLVRTIQQCHQYVPDLEDPVMPDKEVVFALPAPRHPVGATA
jgi:hypothetical protein